MNDEFFEKMGERTEGYTVILALLLLNSYTSNAEFKVHVRDVDLSESTGPMMQMSAKTGTLEALNWSRDKRNDDATFRVMVEMLYVGTITAGAILPLSMVSVERGDNNFWYHGCEKAVSYPRARCVQIGTVRVGCINENLSWCVDICYTKCIYRWFQEWRLPTLFFSL